ncbi:peptide deformylase [Octadecabacter sp. CECT 8868]|uniref:peptide deformylase n=1 Tax=Octadecabacter algicola TaxID=2909342 RepID=UPI00300C4C4E|nr:peptide deformylase [Octadecabacter algicola]
MVTRNVRLWPDAVLSQVCAAVDVHDLSTGALIDDLFDTMYAANGRGLAAPQIGALKRVFVVDVTWKEGPRDPRVFVNPDVLSTSEAIIDMDEQCLSIPDLPMPVSRPDRVQLRWTNRDGQTETAWFDGMLARCIQHEFDHLNGTVIFDHQTPDARTELEAAYVS